MATSFDGPNKLIILSSGTVVQSVQDLWSDWVRWSAVSDNSKYLPAFRLTGGDPIDLAAGTFVPYYVYCLNGWKIRPQESNHTLVVNKGILLVEGGGDPFASTLGGFTVRINYQQPVQAITITTAGGGSSLTEAGIATAVWQLMLANGLTAESNLIKAKQAAENAFAVSA